VSIEDVHKLLSSMPTRSSPLDVLPCSLVKSCAEVFAPVIIGLANLSMQTGKFPARYKRAQVLPLLKKTVLDSSSPTNYRPISNLSTVSNANDTRTRNQYRKPVPENWYHFSDRVFFVADETGSKISGLFFIYYSVPQFILKQ